MVPQIRNEALLLKIGERIKSLRVDANLTQEEFYNDTGIHNRANRNSHLQYFRQYAGCNL